MGWRDHYDALHVGASRLVGKGLFAGTRIPARAKIGEFEGERIGLREARRRARGRRIVAIVEHAGSPGRRCSCMAWSTRSAATVRGCRSPSSSSSLLEGAFSLGIMVSSPGVRWCEADRATPEEPEQSAVRASWTMEVKRTAEN